MKRTKQFLTSLPKSTFILEVYPKVDLQDGIYNENDIEQTFTNLILPRGLLENHVFLYVSNSNTIATYYYLD